MLKRLFQFYIHSSTHVALALVSFAFIRMYEMHIQADFLFLLLIFTAGISGYNFVKFAGVAKLYHRSLTKQLRSIQLYSAFVGLVLIYLIFQLNWQSILLLVALAIINFIYAYPVFKNNRNLRNLPGLKVIIIAIVWASTSVLLPAIAFSSPLKLDLLWLFIQQFLMILALMIPFEIRDFRFDEKNLLTFPHLLGIWKTKLFGILILGICVLIALFASPIIHLDFTLAFVFLLAPLILFSKQEQPLYYASFVVEAVPIISLLIVLLSQT